MKKNNKKTINNKNKVAQRKSKKPLLISLGATLSILGTGGAALGIILSNKNSQGDNAKKNLEKLFAPKKEIPAKFNFVNKQGSKNYDNALKQFKNFKEVKNNISSEEIEEKIQSAKQEIEKMKQANAYQKVSNELATERNRIEELGIINVNISKTIVEPNSILTSTLEIDQQEGFTYPSNIQHSKITENGEQQATFILTKGKQTQEFFIKLNIKGINEAKELEKSLQTLSNLDEEVPIKVEPSEYSFVDKTGSTNYDDAFQSFNTIKERGVQAKSSSEVDEIIKEAQEKIKAMGEANAYQKVSNELATERNRIEELGIMNVNISKTVVEPNSILTSTLEIDQQEGFTYPSNIQHSKITENGEQQATFILTKGKQTQEFFIKLNIKGINEAKELEKSLQTLSNLDEEVPIKVEPSEYSFVDKTGSTNYDDAFQSFNTIKERGVQAKSSSEVDEIIKEAQEKIKAMGEANAYQKVSNELATERNRIEELGIMNVNISKTVVEPNSILTSTLEIDQQEGFTYPSNIQHSKITENGEQQATFILIKGEQNTKISIILNVEGVEEALIEKYKNSATKKQNGTPVFYKSQPKKDDISFPEIANIEFEFIKSTFVDDDGFSEITYIITTKNGKSEKVTQKLGGFQTEEQFVDELKKAIEKLETNMLPSKVDIREIRKKMNKYQNIKIDKVRPGGANTTDDNSGVLVINVTYEDETSNKFAIKRFNFNGRYINGERRTEERNYKFEKLQN